MIENRWQTEANALHCIFYRHQVSPFELPSSFCDIIPIISYLFPVSTTSPTCNHSVMSPRNQNLGLNPVTARCLRSLSLWFTYHVARSFITPEDCCLAGVIDLSQLGAAPRKCTTAADDSCIYTEKGGHGGTASFATFKGPKWTHNMDTIHRVCRVIN